MDFLFQPPPIPILSQTVKSFVDTPFQKYQLSLKRQLVGRSVQLDSVLSTLEHCAKTIQQDLLHLRTNADDKTRFVLLIDLFLPPAIYYCTVPLSNASPKLTSLLQIICHIKSHQSSMKQVQVCCAMLVSSPRIHCSRLFF